MSRQVTDELWAGTVTWSYWERPVCSIEEAHIAVLNRLKVSAARMTSGELFQTALANRETKSTPFPWGSKDRSLDHITLFSAINPPLLQPVKVVCRKVTSCIVARIKTWVNWIITYNNKQKLLLWVKKPVRGSPKNSFRIASVKRESVRHSDIYYT